MKICPKCERQNLNNAAVCKACGASLNVVPNVEVLPDPEPDKRTHIGLAYLFGTLCFFIGFFKELLLSTEIKGPEDPVTEVSAHLYWIYFAALAVSIVCLVLHFIFLRGCLKIKPVNISVVFALLLGMACCVLIGLDLIALPNVIRQFTSSASGVMFLFPAS